MRWVRWLIAATGYLARPVAAFARKLQDRRVRKKVAQQIREVRGIMLLREWLSPVQRAQFDASRFFEVIGCESRKRYRIFYGIAGNIYEVGDDNRLVVSWCFVPSGELVAGDVMLAQKIALETGERGAEAGEPECAAAYFWRL